MRRLIGYLTLLSLLVVGACNPASNTNSNTNTNTTVTASPSPSANANAHANMNANEHANHNMSPSPTRTPEPVWLGDSLEWTDFNRDIGISVRRYM